MEERSLIKRVPLFKVFMASNVAHELSKVFDSGFIGEGEVVKKFEKKLRTLWDTHDLLTLNSGTSALSLAYHLLGLKEGSEVISTPITCLATHTPLLNLGCRIKWADVDPLTGLIDPADVVKKITDKTEAIICVDWGGEPCDYDALKSFGIPVIQDAAHSALTRYNGEFIANTGGDFVCYSLQAIKHLTSGDGGVLKVPQDYYKRAKLLRWYGFDRESSESFRCSQDVKEAGFKCVHALTRVRINDTKSERIMGIVQNKKECLVDSIDEKGNIVQKKVNGWYKNELGDRKWIYLTHEFSGKRNQYKKVKRDYGDNEGVFLTEDHPVLTFRGYIPVNELTDNDCLITANPTLNKEQKDFITGSMLGDGCINKKGDTREWFSVCHSEKQSEWIDIKARYLSKFGGTLSKYKTKEGFSQICYQTITSPVWGIIRERYYKDSPKKGLPNDFSHLELTPRTLATWYMDDGSLNHKAITLCTDRYNKNEINVLRECLNKIGYPTGITSNHEKLRITINTKASKDFFQKITKYIPEQLRYKVPLDISNKIPFDESLWSPSLPLRLLAKPILYHVPPPSRAKHKVYCIDVEETHNFIVGGDIIVHNCHMNNINATIGLCNLYSLKANVAVGKSRALYYDNNISNKKIRLIPYNRDSSYWLYTLHVDDRDGLMSYLKEHGIASSPVHNRNDKYTITKKFRSKLPGVKSFNKTHLCIPVGWWVDFADAERIVKLLNSW